ncbi:hypothetical protein [Mesoflavibacter sp. SCSIO 43206]|uniref:hypothetical protein n=1 Tax=Mesoflavibacter sp. SCSIO 43206 TaxID=2779362 RepID=UPI001CA921F3|nr:hypothetical protein [Mesoflavibacter sp. SCSIO 43206]UAB75662.1 hypothetical protein INR78_01335 [Mesoflavibacter sp. SCSIO 43206]
MKKNYQKILFVLGIPFILFIILVFVGLNKTKNDVEYYKSIGLKLNGKIEAVEKLRYGHDYGVITIDLNYSNINEYDKRNELKRYLGVIKNGKADLVFNSIGSVKKGDSIVIDIQNYKVFRSGKLIRENIIGMPSDYIFTPFNEIKSKINL